MDLNEKVKRAHDDSDNEKEDDSIVWGRENRYSRESYPLNNDNVNNNNNNIGDGDGEPKKIYSKNVWHGDYGNNLLDKDKQVNSAFPTLSTIVTSINV
jgi:hypothetical protein